MARCPLCLLVVALLPLQGFAEETSKASQTGSQRTPMKRDGQHDFDFEIGTWKTHVSRLLNPLTGSPKSCHFEQAFSDDGGKTWEVNWIATDTRMKEESDQGH